ncbi:MAG: hypothetical protein N3A38_01885 [Planctomycetota bacterium]|nr:hypothetical protein [Planctomycetota bacterium]
MRIDAASLHYRRLNEAVRDAIRAGESRVIVENVLGQRYIGCGLGAGARLEIRGVPGNDLAAFMDGAEIRVEGNAQDGVGNTMSAGKVVISGDAGDLLGHSMRGGRIFVRGSAGYRAGVHMKAYGDRFPVVVIGGRVGQYLGEYMAGGVLVVLGVGPHGECAVGGYVGTGMHGGVIFLRGKVEPWLLGREVGVSKPDEGDRAVLAAILDEYRRDVGTGVPAFEPDGFVALRPRTVRPYGRLYAY